MRPLSIIAIISFAFSAWALAADEPIAAFPLREVFGVSHPAQVIDFDCEKKIDPGEYRVLNQRGEELPCQVLRDGKVAVYTALAAGASDAFRLFKGAPAQRGQAKVTNMRGAFSIANNLIELWIPIPAQDVDRRHILAPINRLKLRNQQWTETSDFLHVEASSLKRMTVDFLERGPLKVVARVEYIFDRPEYRYGSIVVMPAGEGFYRCTIEVQHNSPSVLFEEETDMNVSWSLDFYDALKPTQARYRGHHATAAKFGREPDGQTYRASHARPPMDATVDLTYDRPRPSSYVTADDSWRRMAVWDPWVYDSGRYWQLYNDAAGPESPLVGIFAGAPSRAIGAGHSGVGVFTSPAKVGEKQPSAGITMSSFRRGPDARVYPRSRFCWGLFLGTKKDLADPKDVQPIAREMNLHGGISLNKVHRLNLDFPDPPQGYGALYMDRAAVQEMVRKLREDRAGPHGKGYYGYLYQADTYSRDLIDMWADATGQKTRKAADEIGKLAQGLLHALVDEDGIYSFAYHYWHGGLAMMRMGVWIDAVLASGQLSPEQRAAVKSAATLFASILWDDDFVPLFTEHGLNLGTANMPVQQAGYRDFYALLLAGHPMMKARAADVQKRVLETLNQIVNDNGAEIGSAHYIGASFVPTLNTLLQLRMLGKVDPFKTEPRLAKFAEFFMQLHTPPEVRFGGGRKVVAIGDGSTESSEITGQLATGFRSSNPELSKRLMGLWTASGKRHSSFFGSTLLMIDEDAPAADAMLGDGNFPGWCSVLRSGWGTRDESAVWLVNGDFYSDHRHADHGSVVMYALGAPLSVNWGPIYYPHVAGGYMHSMVIPEDKLGRRWDADSPPLDGVDVWRKSRLEGFTSQPASGMSRASFQCGELKWTRAVHLLRGEPDRPIIILRDRFDGAGADRARSSRST